MDGRTVRLGIDAPRSVQVLRNELADEGCHSPPGASVHNRRLDHTSRNRLQTALLTLSLAQRKLELGGSTVQEVSSRIATALEELERLEVEVAGSVPAEGVGQAAAAPSPRRSALVVEDNTNERVLLADYLETCDFEVAVAEDGQDALDYLATHARPDVVLLDMSMPRLDGPATVREIRCNPDLSGVKLIAVSGMAPRQAAATVGRVEVDRWFTKPIRPSVLVQELERELAAPA